LKLFVICNLDKSSNDPKITAHNLMRANFTIKILIVMQYIKPDISLISNCTKSNTVSREKLLEIKEKIISCLGLINIQPERIIATIGQVYYQYEIILSKGGHLKKVKSSLAELHDSFYDKTACFLIDKKNNSLLIEVPSYQTVDYPFINVIKAINKSAAPISLPVPLGADVSQEVYISDLAKIQHILFESENKKQLMNAISVITASLICTINPSTVKFAFIDSAKNDFTIFKPLKKTFLLKLDGKKGMTNNINDGIVLLNSLIDELNHRYLLLQKSRTRNISDYNLKNKKKSEEHSLPYLMIFLKDLKAFTDNQGHVFKTLIARLAVLGSIVGIHLIVGTHQKSELNFGPLIDENFPVRIIFQKGAKKQNKTFIAGRSKEKLLGNGDALVEKIPNYRKNNKSESNTVRLQYPTLEKNDLSRLLNFVKDQ
jgi:DNA segregation ATPase FtsK/SpoIIIE, S-DNA-T family